MKINNKSLVLLITLVILSSALVTSAVAIGSLSNSAVGNSTVIPPHGNGTILKPPTIQPDGPGESKISNKVKSISTSPFMAIDQFEVMYSANTFAPRIWLMNNGTYIGQLIFEPDGTKLPVDSKINGQVNLYYHLADFKNVIDLLENSPKVSLLYVGSGRGNENGIYAAAMNVGSSAIRSAPPIRPPIYDSSNPTVTPKSTVMSHVVTGADNSLSTIGGNNGTGSSPIGGNNHK